MKPSLLLTPVWGCMPSEINESTSLNEFRSELKNSKPEKSPCKLCKIYLQWTGFYNDNGLRHERVKLLISICSQMLLFMFLQMSVCLPCWFFSVCFCFVFCFFFLLSFKPQFKVDLSQRYIPDKNYIYSLTHFGSLIIFHV